MKILHTADWHLGKTLNNIDLLPDQRYILEQLIAIVREEKPEVILIAGDIYDRSLPSAEAIDLLDSVLSEIILNLKIPVIAIAGNHDSAERVAYCQGILEKQGLHVSGCITDTLTPIVLFDTEGEVYFYPIPYTEPDTLQFMLKGENTQAPIRTHQDVMDWVMQQIAIQRKPQDRIILILHAFIAGGQTSDSERDLYVGQAGYVRANTFSNLVDYTALGHLHSPQTFEQGKVQYAGSLLKYSLSEAHQKKGVHIIELGKKHELKQKFIPLKPKRNLQLVQGKIERGTFSITSSNVTEVQTEDLLHITLTHDYIGNAMYAIQQKYPNAVGLRYAQEALMQEQGKPKISLQHLQDMSEVQLLKAFFQKVSDKTDLTEQQTNLLHNILKDLRKEE